MLQSGEVERLEGAKQVFIARRRVAHGMVKERQTKMTCFAADKTAARCAIGRKTPVLGGGVGDRGTQRKVRIGAL